MTHDSAPSTRDTTPAAAASAAAQRPGTDEYAKYYGRYVALVPETSGLQALEAQRTEMLVQLRSIPDAQAGYRYAPGKWSVREMLGHLADSERVFAYRAMWFARGEHSPLPGFSEDPWVQAGGFDRLQLAALTDGLDLARRSTIRLFRDLEDHAWLRRGTANDVEMSVRAVAFVIAGHGRHHMTVLRERYQLGTT